MDPLLEAPADAPHAVALRSATGALRDALQAISRMRLGDSELLAVLGAVEEPGRLIDAARVALAADAADRSRADLGHEGLAWRAGCRNATDLVTRVTRVSAKEAIQRIKLGSVLASHVDALSVAPSRFPVVAHAVSSGALGVESAKLIVDGLASINRICPASELETAERSLVACATGAITDETIGLPGEGVAFAADLIRGQVEIWKACLDPDGVAPSDPGVEPRSSIGFGRLKDGIYPLRGGATPNGVAFSTPSSTATSPPGRAPLSRPRPSRRASKRVRSSPAPRLSAMTARPARNVPTFSAASSTVQHATREHPAWAG